MKRFLSILLSFMILVVGAHPVLAMHFCTSNFYSINLAQPDLKNHSCCDNMKNDSKEHCESQPKSDHKARVILTDKNDNYCQSKQIELSTDNYNNQIQQSNLDYSHFSAIHAWAVFYSLFKNTDIEISVVNKRIFPPGGLSKLNTDLLSYICIYRI